jgi:hypothetical protein
LAKLFIQIGRVEELGSGVRRTNQYVPIYASGETPQFIDGDIFKTIIPLKNNGGVSGGGLIYYDGSAKTGGYFLKELGLRSL